MVTSPCELKILEWDETPQKTQTYHEQICLSIGTVSRVSDMAHGSHVSMNVIQS